jgi:hypothetical protein
MSESRNPQDPKFQTLDYQRNLLGLPETLPFTDYSDARLDTHPAERVNVILERLQAEITTFETIKQKIDDLESQMCRYHSSHIRNQIQYLIRISNKHYDYIMIVSTWNTINPSDMVDELFISSEDYYSNFQKNLQTIKRMLLRSCKDPEIMRNLKTETETLLQRMKEYKAKAIETYKKVEHYIIGGQYNKTRRNRKINRRRKKSKRHKIY